MRSAESDLVFVAHSSQASGAEHVMLTVIDQAVARGLRVQVLCPPGPLCARLPAGVGHVPIPELGLAGQRGGQRLRAAAVMARRWARAARVLRGLTAGGGARVVVNSTMALPAVALSLPRRGSAVWLVHDVLASRRQRAVAVLGRAGIGSAVAVSERAAEPVRRLGYHVRVAWQGVDWPVDPAPVGPGTPPLVVGILGVVTEWKGHHVLLAAAADLAEVRIEIAGVAHPGDETYLAELEERAGRPDLAGRVRFLGRVDALSTIRRWDVLVSPSVLPEAGPLVVLEAMSVGVPVIATDHSGNVDPEAALPIPVDDPRALRNALHRLAVDPALRAELGTAGRRIVAARHDRSVALPTMLDALLAAGHR